MHGFAALLHLLILLSLVSLPAFCQEPVGTPPSPPAPYLAKARGAVSLHRGDPAQPLAPDVDGPLHAGDHLMTGKRSAAEIRIDPSHVAELDDQSEIRIAEIDGGWLRLELLKGSLTYRVDTPSPSSVDIVTGAVSARPVHPGDYRMAMEAHGQSAISALAGGLEIYGPGGSQWLSAGQKLTIRSGPAGPEFKIGNAVSLWRRMAVVLANAMSNLDFGGSSDDSGSSSQASNSDSSNNTGSSKAAAGNAKTDAAARPGASGSGSGHSGPGAPGGNSRATDNGARAATSTAKGK